MDSRDRRMQPVMSQQMPRRAFLSLSAAFAAAALAACGDTANSSPTTGAASKPGTTPGAAGTAAPVAANPTSAVTGSSTSPTSVVSTGGKFKLPLFTTQNDPASLAFYQRTITAYKAQHPEVDLEITLYQDENQLQYLTTAFANKTDLGIFVMPSAQVANWARQNYLLPIDSLVKKVGEGDFLPGTRVTIDSHDYAMPFQSNASAVWVRQDLLQSAGLAIPKTYDEYLGVAKTLHGKDGIIGIASGTGAVPELTLQYFSPYIFQSGWDYFDKEGNLTFDKPEVLDAVKRFAGILKYTSPSFYNVTFQDILNAYISGRAAMGTFPGRLGVNLDAKAPDIAEKTTVIPIPAGPFMPTKLLYGAATHYGVFSKTAHPAEALDFLQFMTTGDRSLDFAMTVPGHLLPPLESVRKLVPDYKSPFMDKHRDWVVNLLNMVPGAMNTPTGMGAVSNKQFTQRISNICPWASRVWSNPPIDGAMFQEILIKGRDPEQAWTDAVGKMRAAADGWKKENPTWKPTA